MKDDHFIRLLFNHMGILKMNETNNKYSVIRHELERKGLPLPIDSTDTELDITFLTPSLPGIPSGFRVAYVTEWATHVIKIGQQFVWLVEER